MLCVVGFWLATRAGVEHALQEADARVHLPLPVAGAVVLLRALPPQPDPGRHLFGQDRPVGQPQPQAHARPAQLPLGLGPHGPFQSLGVPGPRCGRPRRAGLGRLGQRLLPRSLSSRAIGRVVLRGVAPSSLASTCRVPVASSFFSFRNAKIEDNFSFSRLHSIMILMGLSAVFYF